MGRAHTVEEYIEVLKSKLGEAKGNYKKALGLRDCGVKASHYKAKIETLALVISNLEQIQNNVNNENYNEVKAL